MPDLHMAIPEISSHIYEPISSQFIKKTIADLGLTSDIENRIYVQYGYSAIKHRRIKTFDVNLSSNKVNCDVTVNFKPDTTKFEAYTFMHAPAYGVTVNGTDYTAPIFYDATTNVRVFEYASPVSVTTNYSFSFVTRSLAYSVLIRMLNLYSVGQIITSSDVAFTYPLPPAMLNIMYQLYKMQRNPEYDYPTYLLKNSNGSLAFDTNRTISSIEVVVPRSMKHILSLYENDNDRPSEVRINQSNDAYELKLTHTYQAAFPNAFRLEYPINIDNQLVPEHLVYVNKTKELEALSATSSIVPFRHIQDNLPSKSPAPLVLPSYDEWIVPTESDLTKGSYIPIFIASFPLDEHTDADGNLIDIKDASFYLLSDTDFGGYAFHPMIDEFLLLQGQESFGLGVLFNLSIFKDNTRMYGDMNLTLSHYGDLTVTSSDFRMTHRIVISQLTDLSKLDTKWYPYITDWMTKYCKQSVDSLCCPYLPIFDRIDEYEKKQSFIPGLISDQKKMGELQTHLNRIKSAIHARNANTNRGTKASLVYTIN